MPSALKIAFYISIPIAVIAIFFLVFFPIIRKKRIASDQLFLGYVGKKLYEFAEKKDYYLLNQLEIPIDSKTVIHIDHLLFGNKYIYVIADKYIDGALSAKEDDEKWLKHTSLKSNPILIPNPLKRNMQRLDKLVEKLNQFINIDKDMLVSIVICNNDCAYNNFLYKNKHQLFVKLKYFPAEIKLFESREKVQDISQMDLEYLVKEISDLNLLNKYKNTNNPYKR